MSRATKVFKPKPISVTAPTKSRQGYPAWVGDARDRYIQTLLTNTIGNVYYADQNDLFDMTEQVHTEALAWAKSNPKTGYKFIANALVYARNKGFMRLQPVYGLARFMEVHDEAAAPHIAWAFNKVILTPKDLADLMAISKSLHGDKTEGGRRIKKLAGDWLLNLTEYWAIKYGAEKSDGDYSLSDMIRITHPDAGGKKLPIFDYLLSKTTDLTEIPQVWEFEKLKGAKTDEEKAAAIKAGRLPHEVASSFAGKSKVVWEAIAREMPTFAMLRHLRTLEELGLIDPLKERIEYKLLSPDTIKKAKIFPFRLVSAFNKVGTTWVKDVLRKALDVSVSNVPVLNGKPVIILDRSGSMASERDEGAGAFMTTAAIFGLSLARRAVGGARVMLYDNNVEEFPFSRVDSLLTQALSIRARGGTYTALPFEMLLNERYRADTIVLLTDEQQNIGDPVVDILTRYKKLVNPNVQVFIVDVAPYTEKLTPPDMKNVWYLYGWSDNVLNFIAMAQNGFTSLADTIENYGGDIQLSENGAAMPETQGESVGQT